MEKSDKEIIIVNNSFKEYTKNNIFEIIVILFTTIAVYGAWAFQYFVSFDAEGLYMNVSHILENPWYVQWLTLGRWSFVFLKKFLGVLNINPFFSISMFLMCFSLSIILWNYLFYKIGLKQKYFFGTIIFDLFYITHPIWALQFAYRNQIEVLSIIAVLLPICINGLIYIIEDFKLKKCFLLFIVIIGIIFCFAGYQSFVFMYLTFCVIYMFVNIFINKIENKVFYKRMIILALISIISFIGYLISMKLVCKLANISTASGYFKSQFLWFNNDFDVCMNKLLLYLKDAFKGNNIAYTNIFVIEGIIGIFIYINNFKKLENYSRRICGLILYICLFIIPFFLTICTAGEAVHRQQFAYVLALSFIASFEFYYITTNFKLLNNNYVYYFLIFVLMIGIINQVQLNTRLLYSDYYTMNVD